MADLRQQLDSSLPAGQLALLKWLAEQAAATGDQLFVVGGFVRDLILGTASLDFDFVVEGDAIALARSLADRYGGQVHSHRRFGTAKWTLDPHEPRLRQVLDFDDGELPERLDFVTSRSESYEQPSALPSVQQGDIRGDLERRDFSINALALRLDGEHYGELLDPLNGMRDLERKRIRVLHPGSFHDDPTRTLRAVRLEQRLGFEIGTDTLRQLGESLELLDRVSGERIRNELVAMFQEPSLVAIMQRLSELGLLRAIHPELAWDAWLAARFQAAQHWHAPEQWRLAAEPQLERLLYGLWVYRLDERAARSVCERLKLSLADRAVALHAGRYDCRLSDPQPPSRIARCLEPMSESALAATWLALEGESEPRRSIERYLAEWRWVRPTTDGHRLRELGLPPGPAYGRILGRLRDAWLDGQISGPEQEQQLLEELVSAAEGDG